MLSSYDLSSSYDLALLISLCLQQEAQPFHDKKLKTEELILVGTAKDGFDHLFYVLYARKSAEPIEALSLLPSPGQSSIIAQQNSINVEDIEPRLHG